MCCLYISEREKIQMDKELLQKYVEGNVTTEEIEAVVDWLDVDEKHVKEFMALHKLYDISILNQVQRRQKQIERNRMALLRRIGLELLRVAAVALIFLGGKFLLDKAMYTDTPLQYQTLYVPAGQRAELILPDSTRVWLNAHSRLIYPVSFQKESREVELDGEAYFDVRHNESSPFVVKTKNMEIKVLGTEFNVLAYSEIPEFEIALLKGRVELKSVDLSHFYRMQAGEQVWYKEGRYVTSRIKDMDYFRWKEGLLCFSNQTIEEIIEKLCLYYDIRIEVYNKSFLDECYSGKFRVKDGVDQVLKVLQLEHKFTYIRDNELNLITIN